nr:hypothetical protein CFP56_32218 [Quercus suber]
MLGSSSLIKGQLRWGLRGEWMDATLSRQQLGYCTLRSAGSYGLTLTSNTCDVRVKRRASPASTTNRSGTPDAGPSRQPERAVVGTPNGLGSRLLRLLDHVGQCSDGGAHSSPSATECYSAQQ